jgi:ribosomal protein S18 acetylase RimI-like enzyme
MTADLLTGPTVLRAARVGDAHAIVAAVRSGFTDEQLGMFIYGCHGIERYVEYELGLPPAASSAMYLVAEHNGTVVGCADFRSGGSDVFLNYISVLPSHRALRIGTSLLAEGIRRADKAAERLVLDVLERNVVAQNWYRHLGLSRIGSTIWWEVSPPEVRDLAFGITGWPQAEASQQVFAFSTFTITTSTASYVVGRLGRDWFRVTAPAAIVDAEAWAALKAIDPNRRVLALIEDGGMPSSVEPRCRRLTSTLRLSGPLRDVETRLAY